MLAQVLLANTASSVSIRVPSVSSCVIIELLVSKVKCLRNFLSTMITIIPSFFGRHDEVRYLF